MDFFTISESSFDRLHDLGSLSAGTGYRIIPTWTTGYMWAYSPDGYGCFFYDSQEELEEQH